MHMSAPDRFLVLPLTCLVIYLLSRLGWIGLVRYSIRCIYASWLFGYDSTVAYSINIK